MSHPLLGLLLDALRPELTPWVLACARFVPVTWLCPLLGGQGAPPPVRLGLAMTLAWLASARAAADGQVALGPLALAPLILREAGLGTALGLLAAAPFEAARFGGRMVDLARGTSAEALLPGVGTREAATAELLARLTVALGWGATAWTVRALLRTVVVVPLGRAHPGSEGAVFVAAGVVGILASGLALAAPVAFLALVLDAVLGFAARGAQAPGLFEVAAPARILGGGALLWLVLGVAADRLLDLLASAPGALTTLAGSWG
jgi:type III secretion protein T